MYKLIKEGTGVTKAHTFSDDYAVRIYCCNRRRLVGTADNVGTQDKSAFTTVEELWHILTPRKKGSFRRTEQAEGR